MIRYMKQTAQVLIADGMSNQSVIGKDVRQGCLFSIYVEMVIADDDDRSDRRNRGRGPNWRRTAKGCAFCR